MAVRLWQAETTIVAMLIFISASHPGIVMIRKSIETK